MNTAEYIALIVGCFALSSVFTIVIRKVAIRKAILDVPNHRSSHTVPTPRGGGLAISLAWFAGILYLFYRGELDSTLFYAFLPGIALVFVGIADDIISLSPRIRILVQAAASAGAIILLGGLQRVDFGFYTFENVYILSIIAFVAFIWMINLFNFIDGIDGYAASETLFITITAYVFLGGSSLLVLAMSILGFLIFNWQKARIFMGDVGSTLLGYNVVVFAVYFQNEEISSVFLWAILSSAFWFDATLTLIRRVKRKEKLSEAHRNHAYQRIVRAGWSHQKTVLVVMLVNLIAGAGIIWLVLDFPEYILAGFLGNAFVMYLAVKIVDKRFPFS